MKTEIAAYNDVEVFVRDILEVDWLWPKQWEMLKEFYNPKMSYTTFVAVCGMRCLTGDNEILTNDGTYRKVADLKNGDVVFGFKDSKVIPSPIIIKQNEELKECVEITTFTGRIIKVTNDHKIYTQCGLVEAGKLTTNDYIYIQRTMLPNEVHDPNAAGCLGYILGDGGLSTGYIHFTNYRDEITVDFMDKLYDRFGGEVVPIKSNGEFVKGNYRVNSVVFLKYLRELNLMYTNSHTKFIPDIVYAYDKESLIEFIRGIFLTDGCVEGRGNVTYSTVSSNLAIGVQRILAKLGIRSYIDWMHHTHGIVVHVVDNDKFKVIVGDFREREINDKKNYSSPIDRIPFTITDLGISVNQARIEDISVNSKNNLSLMNLKKVNDKLGLNDEFLIAVSNDEMFYDKVTSIKDIGSKITYDICVDGVGNFFVNDILVKNSGKTTVASIIECKELFDLLMLHTPAAHYKLPKGQQIFVMNVASSEQQSKDTIFAQTKARIENSTWFQEQNYNQRGSEFVFQTEDAEIVLRSSHSNSGSIAGKTSKCVLFDEIARFKQTGGPGSAQLVYETMSRQVKTFGNDGRIVSISSPMYVDDFQMQLYRMHKDNKKSYRIHLPTWEMNPNLPFNSFQAELQNNPEAFWRDYGAQPPSSLEIFFKEPGRIDNAVNPHLPLLTLDEYLWAKDAVGAKNTYYVVAGDPALKNDAFGFAMGHYDASRNKIIIDLAHRFVPGLSEDKHIREIDASKVKSFCIEGIARFNITHFITDTWNFPETMQEIESHDVTITQNHVNKVHYDNLKELMYTNPPGIEIPDNSVLLDELKGLELLRGQRVDHPRHGSKDIADAVANVVWALKEMEIDNEEPIFMPIDL